MLMFGFQLKLLHLLMYSLLAAATWNHLHSPTVVCVVLPPNSPGDPFMKEEKPGYSSKLKSVVI